MNPFKKALLAVFSKLMPGLGQKAAILMYHSVDTNPSFFTTRPGEFERQMRHLKDRYTVVSLSELVEKLANGEPIKGLVAITFDDGYADFFKHAFPILKKYGFPATVFLITDKLGKTMLPSGSKEALKIMSGGDVARAAMSPMIEFMPHTATHPDLNAIPFDEALKEINDSRRAVESLTKKPADIFAYPKGKRTKEIVEHLRTSGDWLSAVTAETGLISQGDNLFELKRIPVDSTTTFPIFQQRLTRGIEAYEAVKPK